MNPLSNIRIVLVCPTHPGNIGAVARAMKTMGLTNLYLVKPKLFPHEEAEARAKHAKDVLISACVVDSLQDALQGCQLVLALSARPRTLTWPTLPLSEAAKKAGAEAQSHPIAIVFGRERSCLTNEELQLCHYRVFIPANPECSSLNLASAVQVVAYEIYQAVHNEPAVASAADYATMEELAGFYDHFERVLNKIGYLKPDQPGQLMHRLHRLYNRARLERSELNIMRGILKVIENLDKS